jgi:hypothetical protein
MHETPCDFRSGAPDTGRGGVCAGGRRKPAGAPAAARRCRGAAPPRRSGALPAAPVRRRGPAQRRGRCVQCGDDAAAHVAAVGGRVSRRRGRFLSGRVPCRAAPQCGQRPRRGRRRRRCWASLRARARQSSGRRRRHSRALRPAAAAVRIQSGPGAHALVGAGLEAPAWFHKGMDGMRAQEALEIDKIAAHQRECSATALSVISPRSSDLAACMNVCVSLRWGRPGRPTHAAPVQARSRARCALPDQAPHAWAAPAAAQACRQPLCRCGPSARSSPVAKQAPRSPP